jgi:sulfur-carrier protein
MKPNDSKIATVNIRYFARLREALGRDSEELALPEGIANVGALLALLRERGGAWEKELGFGRPVRVAVNQDMADIASPVVPGDEVAVFPPVTGG